jgi:DNA polymerase III epsilon subunit-like protein
MKYLVIDTETNGVFDFKLPADAEGQARLAHLAMIYLDEGGNEERRNDIYVRPNGWTMSAEASAVNGLTDEFLIEQGTDVVEALNVYQAAIEEGRSIVAFHAQFDCKVMRGEFRRLFLPDLFEQTNNICVMRPMVTLCGLKQEGSNRAKFPKLAEALAYFGVDQTNAHKAINDAENAAILFRELKARDLLPEASVHYAKNKPEGTPVQAKAPRKKAAAKKSAPAPRLNAAGLPVGLAAPADLPDSF